MIQRELNTWTVVQMYCPSCGTLSTGYRDQNGSHRFQCQHCGVVMVRSYKSRRQDLIEVTLPKGTERLSG